MNLDFSFMDGLQQNVIQEQISNDTGIMAGQNTYTDKTSLKGSGELTEGVRCTIVDNEEALTLKGNILDSMNNKEPIEKLFIMAIEALGSVTNDSLYGADVKQMLQDLYGCGVQQDIPAEWLINGAIKDAHELLHHLDCIKSDLECLQEVSGEDAQIVKRSMENMIQLVKQSAAGINYFLYQMQ